MRARSLTMKRCVFMPPSAFWGVCLTSCQTQLPLCSCIVTLSFNPSSPLWILSSLWGGNSQLTVRTRGRDRESGREKGSPQNNPRVRNIRNKSGILRCFSSGLKSTNKRYLIIKPLSGSHLTTLPKAPPSVWPARPHQDIRNADGSIGRGEAWSQRSPVVGASLIKAARS